MPITLRACSSLHALHSYPDETIDETAIIRRSNSLQVTIQSRGIIYDLADKEPKAINEIPAMHHLLDC